MKESYVKLKSKDSNGELEISHARVDSVEADHPEQSLSLIQAKVELEQVKQSSELRIQQLHDEIKNVKVHVL